MNILRDFLGSFFELLLIFAVALFIVDLATHAKGITSILNSVFGEINAGYGREAQAAGNSYNPPRAGRG
jgi:hypothetical protein